MFYFWDIFRQKTCKNYCHNLNQQSQNCQNTIFLAEQKTLNFRPKVPYLGVFRMQFWKTIFIFEIRAFEFIKNKFVQNKKIKSNFGWTKDTLFCYFWALILKKYYHIWNQQYRICQDEKFRPKIETLKFGTKNVSCEYFWAVDLKAIVIFEITTQESVYLQIFV